MAQSLKGLRPAGVWVSLWLSLVLCAGTAAAATLTTDGGTGGAAAPLATPIGFEVNQGQTDGAVKFLARQSGMNVFLLRNELVLSFVERDPEPAEERLERLRSGRPRGLRADRSTERPTVIRMKLLRANPRARAVGVDPLPGKSHYLIGNDSSKWQRNVTRYAKVEVQDVYPGVSLVLHGERGRLEYDFVVSAGADVGVVDLQFEGMKDASVSPEGDLLLPTRKGQVRHLRPAAHQESAGVRAPVESRFIVKGPGHVGFGVAGHDRGLPVVIDPLIIYETLVGGSLDEAILGVAADSLGNAYVIGETASPDFPVTQGAPIGYEDVFVQKLDPQGVVVYSVLLGGSDTDYGRAIAVDREGRPNIGGDTYSDDFPVRNPFQPTRRGSPDTFVARLTADGTDFEISTYYGGTGDSFLRALALDFAGNIYIGGQTHADDLPLAGQLETYSNLGSCNLGLDFDCLDAFVAKFSFGGALTFGTYMGGREDDFVLGIAADGAGKVYIVGGMDYSQPLTKPLWDSGGGFLAEIDTIDPKVVFSTRLHGFAYAVALDPLGSIYVAGLIDDYPDLPPVNAAQPAFGGGGSDAFLMKIRADGSAPVYATYFGTADYWEEGRGLAVAADGSAYLAGFRQLWLDGNMICCDEDPFLAWFDPDGGLGGSWYSGTPGRQDWAYSVAVDPWGDVYVGGLWNFHNNNSSEPHETTADGFLVKFDGEFLDLPADCRDCTHDVGLPVNLFTGSVWLSQTDVVLPGVTGISFTRSYNAVGIREPTVSSFGPGWTHPFEQNLGFPPGALRLRQGNGMPITFTDQGGVYRASLPATETSWIAKSGDTYTRHFLQGGSEDYDKFGRLTVIRDAVGNETTLTWQNSLLSAVRDAGGRQLTVSYAGARISSISGPDGTVADYGYDDFGRLQTVSYPDGTGYRFTYDTNGLLLRVEDGSGHVVETHTYDDQKRAITSEVGNGVERYTLTYAPGMTTVTDALGNAAVYEWTKFGGVNQVTRRTGPCASCGGAESEEWTYYGEGRVQSHKLGSDPSTTYTYYPTGDVQTTTDALGRTTSYTYDGQSRMLTRTAPGRGTTTWTQSPAGPLSVTEPVTGSETRTTSFTYTPQGKLETITDPQSKVTTNVYDGFGDLKVVRDPLGHEARFDYDGMGRRTVVTDALGHKTITAYDSRGRVTRVTADDGTFTEFRYNDRGLRESVTDPLGRKTQSTYDAYGRLDTVIDDSGKTTKYTYDVLSRMASLTDALGHVTSFEYDGQGRLKRTVYPGGRAETLTYDASGRLKTRQDRKGLTTTYAYDDAGRLLGKTYSDSSPGVSFGYDDADRLTSAANGTDNVTRTYDLAGELLTETSSQSGTIQYVYDTTGRRSSVGFGTWSTFLSYVYDDASRLTSLTRNAQVFGFAYDTANRRTSMTYPNGVVTSYGYDNLNRLTSVSAVRNALVIAQAGYGYDAAGNRTSKTTPEVTESYGYDRLYRLTSVERGGGGSWGYGYDAVGNRQTTQAGSSVATALFSDRNELLSVGGGGLLRVRGKLSEAGTATVAGVSAQMSSGDVFEAQVEVGSGPRDLVIEAKDASGNVRTSTYHVDVANTNVSYGYDLNGNLTSRNDGTSSWTYEWTVENQLQRVLRDGSEIARFSYDAFGRRVEKVAGGVSTSWVYDGDDILQETISSGPAAGTFHYIHGPGVDQPLAREDSSTNLTYYHADGLGSIVATTNQAGAVVSTRAYDAWGNLETGAAEPGYAFTGREWDLETGLYYYRARYYDPKAGRFISEDPIGLTGGIDFYTYVNNAPVNAIDPSGLSTVMLDPELQKRMFGTPPAPNATPQERALYRINAELSIWGFGMGAVGMVAQTTASASRLVGHHVLPRAFREFFERAGVNIDNYLVHIPEAWHQKWVHAGKGFGPGGRWHNAWRQFIARKPNATPEEIFEQLLRMLDEIGLCP